MQSLVIMKVSFMEGLGLNTAGQQFFKGHKEFDKKLKSFGHFLTP